LLASKACDVTGVVGIACARHGCFVPNALVDLFKGEQQKNVDFAFLKALTTLGIDPDQGVLLIYDIACQYVIHLAERIGHLLPPGLSIDQAIDLFHVHAHKDECFFRFATTFIPGAAVVAGQIIESLWSNLNSISPTVRTATLPHRAEVLDDHACDSNHKKMLSMADTLRRRFLDATTMVNQADLYYLEITRTIDPAALRKWEHEVKSAERLRSTDLRVMDIYAARIPDSAAGETAGSATLSASSSASAPLDQWMEYLLLVEETQ
jgi:Kyakuja-Dileera-Zisupton transposase